MKRWPRPWWFDALVAACLFTALVLFVSLICHLTTGRECQWTL